MIIFNFLLLESRVSTLSYSVAKCDAIRIILLAKQLQPCPQSIFCCILRVQVLLIISILHTILLLLLCPQYTNCAVVSYSEVRKPKIEHFKVYMMIGRSIQIKYKLLYFLLFEHKKG